MFEDEELLYTVTKVVVATVFLSIQIVNININHKSILSLNIKASCLTSDNVVYE